MLQNIDDNINAILFLISRKYGKINYIFEGDVFINVNLNINYTVIEILDNTVILKELIFDSETKKLVLDPYSSKAIVESEENLLENYKHLCNVKF